MVSNGYCLWCAGCSQCLGSEGKTSWGDTHRTYALPREIENLRIDGGVILKCDRARDSACLRGAECNCNSALIASCEGAAAGRSTPWRRGIISARRKTGNRHRLGAFVGHYYGLTGAGYADSGAGERQASRAEAERSSRATGSASRKGYYLWCRVDGLGDGEYAIDRAVVFRTEGD